jgi:hypothetical protein
MLNRIGFAMIKDAIHPIVPGRVVYLTRRGEKNACKNSG